MDASAKVRVGAKMLDEIEETNLDEILTALRATLDAPDTPPSITTVTNDDSTTTAASNRRKDGDIASYPIPHLDALVSRNRYNVPGPAHVVPLQLNGRYMPLIYELISKLVTHPCRQAVVLVDTEHRFDATRLAASQDDLRHVHVYRPARCSPEHLRELIAGAESWMLYGPHESRTREWWGTLVIGVPSNPSPMPATQKSATSNTVRVTASWKGWLRVDREEVAAFPLGTSAREALIDRQKRQNAVNAACWVAWSQHGGLYFGLQRECDAGLAPR